MADAAADKYGLPRELVRSVMAAESGMAPGAISPKGAIGLMQLMPGTAQVLGVNPYDPAQNVDAGARYLRELLEKYDYGLRHAWRPTMPDRARWTSTRAFLPTARRSTTSSRIEKRLKAANAIQ